ncbi:facilitated trehalose transporter Tret1-like isoform X1 [Ostrinia nubilalis]|uniref:facilitated trehalose transporter Tret1-like isoform X1 n=2 Tax=Ostrinia nubilalis TaxID=29057 RepID=UPI00308268E9
MKIYRKQYLFCFFASLGQILFGYTAGWPAQIVAKLRDPDQFPEAPSDLEVNWMVSSTVLGAAVGAIAFSSISNTLGRKPYLIVGGLGYSLSYLGTALIKSIAGLLVFRVFTGVFIAMLYTLSFVYIGEIASTEIRGTLLGTAAVYVNIGFLLAYTTGGYMSYQAVNYLPMAIGIVFLGGILCAPETPIYHIIQDREKEAKAVLISLNRKEDAEKISQLKTEVQESMTKQKWKALFTVKCNRKALMITVILNMLVQFSGPIIMGAYTTMVFEMAGSSVTPFIGTIIIGVVQVLSGIITPVFIERCGRRILLMISTSLAGLSLLALAIYLYLYDIGHPVIAQIQWMPLVVFIIYCFTYTFGFGSLPSALMGEMFEMNVRSAGSSIVMSSSYFAGVITVMSFGYIITSVGIYVAIIIFSMVCFVAFVFTIFFVPETKGKSLIEVQKMLGR